MDMIIKPVLPAEWLHKDTQVHINPTGKFVIGGPMGDCGLTGRKIIVDTYGGMARHGGGAFSGKDPSKVDRSAAYAGRYVAKNIVARAWPNAAKSRFPTHRCGRTDLHQRRDLRYQQGRPCADREAGARAFRSASMGIITMLDLLRPIYRQTASYGHFGREDIDLPWERTDKAGMLREGAGI